MNEQKLNEITTYLKENVFKNPDIMYTEDDTILDLLEMIASLHNLLYEEVTGERYDYMFHWANKIGSWVDDDFFDGEIGVKNHD